MTDETPDPADPEDGVEPVEPEEVEPEREVDPGEVLFYEPGGSRWVVLIGPVLVLAVMIMEIAGPGQVHWPVLIIFLVILFGFSLVQVSAARRHVSVELTETTLRQGAVTTPLADIEKIYPPNNSPTPEDWESARALGELHGVPRRRKGVGVRLTSGDLAQAWARDVEVFRSELTQAHAAVRMGLPPSAKKPSLSKDETRKTDAEESEEGQDTTE
ncbi:DUF3093 domain-containing protein [Gordonia rubripertincta]|uniref:DUF3093 domain-containing protein n=2 Tax=Gordonia rubripertincta TaxID=36822 RepID=A0AAW6RFZ2_GORRU|nr:hypothetical protein [Gordonia rubripertincta]MDG6783446.1 DUF3093 domain-containing protein [Gordonia rubripertincta]NKY62169.1 DUF3093 domain-containing protein [Gordonia rubripertincta]QMU22716.1 DUF3093 domain-containing protein [Gordonia rubripertincta]GAB83520.1 hypothetical protein GORBP_012_00320 [Gordonia rubripertincta NBRC 101908]